GEGVGRSTLSSEPSPACGRGQGEGRAVVRLYQATARSRRRYWFCSVRVMISRAVMFTPQGGNSLGVKKLSVRSGKKLTPGWKWPASTYGIGTAIDCGSTWPCSAVIAAF